MPNISSYRLTQLLHGVSGPTYTLTVATGSYALTGQAVTLRHDYILPITPGSYTLTGQPVGLVFSRVLSVTTGLYSLNGQPVILAKGYQISLAQGQYSLIGEAVNFSRTYVIALAPGLYQLDGQAVNLVWSNAPLPPTPPAPVVVEGGAPVLPLPMYGRGYLEALKAYQDIGTKPPRTKRIGETPEWLEELNRQREWQQREMEAAIAKDDEEIMRISLGIE